jgi:hypothetical protein
MLILDIFLDQKLAKYFLRKTHFKMTVFEFVAVWSPLPPPPSSCWGGQLHFDST